MQTTTDSRTKRRRSALARYLEVRPGWRQLSPIRYRVLLGFEIRIVEGDLPYRVLIGGTEAAGFWLAPDAVRYAEMFAGLTNQTVSKTGANA
jgi:hypothetical protein